MYFACLVFLVSVFEGLELRSDRVSRFLVCSELQSAVSFLLVRLLCPFSS